MRSILSLLLMFATLQAIGQAKGNAPQFQHAQLSASQFIHSAYLEYVSQHPTDTVCYQALCSMKFEVDRSGNVNNIKSSLGMPAVLIKPLRVAIAATNGMWKWQGRKPFTCILPVLIWPSALCNERTESQFVHTGAYMFTYKGEYKTVQFGISYASQKSSIVGLAMAPIYIAQRKPAIDDMPFMKN